MAVSPIDIIIFAPLAPIFGVLLFWFLQLLFIENQKYLLSKIRPKHKPLCRFTNFIGILFQTICHALGYTVTMSGVSHFHITVHYGKVKPKKDKKGIFEWISNTFLFLGPFFIPSLLLLISLYFLIENRFTILTPSDFSFSEGLILFGTNLYTFTESFFSFLARIDLLHPAHLGFFLFLIFLGLGIRPSYIGEEKKAKVDILYDLNNIKDHLVQKPLYILLLILFAYLFFYLSFYLNANWYIGIFTIFGWLSIIAIIALLITYTLLLLIRTTDDLPKGWRILPYFTLPFSYITMRSIFYFIPIEQDLTISLGVMIIATIAVILVLLKYKTNKFKSKTKMKQGKVEDGPGRTPQE